MPATCPIGRVQDVVQHIKPWTPPPVKVRDDEPQPARIQDVPQQASAADARAANIGDLIQTPE